MQFSLFLKTTNFEFVWKDEGRVVQNAMIHSPSRENFGQIWKGEDTGPYTPVTHTYLALIAAIEAKIGMADAQPDPTKQNRTALTMRPSLFHLGNVVLHTANAILVFFILSLLLRKTTAAVIGSLFFSLHPLQAEAVASISEVAYPLGSFFAFFAILKYLEFCRKPESQYRSKGKSSIKNYYLATGAYVLAILSLPTLVVLPAVAFALENILPKDRGIIPSRRPLWPLINWAVIAIPVTIITISTQNAQSIASEIPLWTRPLLASDAINFYLQKLFIPLSIGPDYGRSPTYVLSKWWTYVSWTIPVTITCVLLFWKENSRAWIAAGSLCFVVALVPSLGFISYQALGTSTVANRYVYFALIGPAISIAYLASQPKSSTIRIIAAAALSFFAIQSYRLTEHWRSDDSLWRHAIEVNPLSPVAHRLLGDRLRANGDLVGARLHYEIVLKTNTTDEDTYFYLAQIEEELGSVQEAVALYQKSLALHPGLSRAHDAIGAIFLKEKKYSGAAIHFQRSTDIKPDYPQANFYLGQALALQGRHQEAISAFRASIKAGVETLPGKQAASTQAWLGHTLAAIGQTEMGKIHLDSALEIDPNNPEANRFLGHLLFSQGRTTEALSHYLGSIEAFPDDIETLDSIAHIYLELEDYTAARAYADRMVRLDPKYAKAHESLGIILFRINDTQAAATALMRALQLNPELADSEYYLGEIARESSDKEQALTHYYAATKASANHPQANIRLAESFIQQGRFAEAIQHYRTALNGRPGDQGIIAAIDKAERNRLAAPR